MISQVAILGSAFRFDLPATQKISVRWFVVGCGEYALGPVKGTPDEFQPPDRAVDVYLEEWVQIQLFLYRELLSDELSAHITQPIRMIRPTSRGSGPMGR